MFLWGGWVCYVYYIILYYHSINFFVRVDSCIFVFLMSVCVCICFVFLFIFIFWVACGVKFLLCFFLFIFLFCVFDSFFIIISKVAM